MYYIMGKIYYNYLSALSKISPDFFKVMQKGANWLTTCKYCGKYSILCYFI